MIFFINECQQKNDAGDVEAFKSIDALAIGIELPDVLNGIYWVFDSDGYFYDIIPTGERSTAFNRRTEFVFRRSEFLPQLATNVVKQALEDLKLVYHENDTLEENGKSLIRCA